MCILSVPKVRIKFGKMKNIQCLTILYIVYCYALYMDSSLGCTEPQPVLHAYRYTDNTSLPERTWVNYTCYQNYYWISGDLARECLGGSLNGQPPVCSEYKVLTPAYTAIPKPGSADAKENHLTDDDELTCGSTTLSSDPSWTIEFNGMKQVFSVELTVGVTTNTINRIKVHVRNTTTNPSALCRVIDLPLASPSSVLLNCPSNLVGSHLVIEGSGTGLGELGLCEVKAKGKDWLSECGDAPFVYGAEVTSNTIEGGDVVVQYSCVEGFYYGGKNPVSTCLNGQWTEADILCLPYDSLYNPNLKEFLPKYWIIIDDDPNTCVEVDDLVITSLQYRRIGLNLYYFKLVELLSVTVTIGVSESWDDLEFVGVPIAKLPHEAPLCKYDGLSTDPYRVRTFYCQPYAYSQILYIIIRDISSNLKELCEIKSTVRVDTEALECIRGENVNEYKGKMNYTWDRKLCDNWADAPPDKAINTSIHKTFDPDSELNYCRNIGGEKQRPWCWVDNFQSVGYCPLTFCNEICNIKEEYTEYKGKQSFTTSGKQCQIWSDGKKEGRKFLAQVFSDGVQAGPYCRNPGYSQFRAWCYADDPVSTIVPEPCDVPHCPTGFLQLTVRNNETSTYPIYLHQCYNPLDSFNVQHYFDLTIEESTINSLCRYFQDKLLFCFTGGKWTMVEFECFDVPPETAFIADTSSPSPDTTFLMDEISTNFVEDSSSMETSSQFVVVSSSMDASSPVEASSSVEANSSVETSPSVMSSSTVEATFSIETSSSVVASSTLTEIFSFVASSSVGESSAMDASSLTTSVRDLTSRTVQPTHSLNPSFSVSSADTASVTSALPERTDTDPPSNMPVICSTTITVTQTLNIASSSSWYESTSNDSGSNKTCGCFCIRDYLLNSSDPVVKARLEILTLGLEMDYEKLSATIRKRISVEDDRPSVLYVGSTAVLIMVMCFAVILFSDALNLCRFLHRRWRYTRQTN